MKIIDFKSFKEAILTKFKEELLNFNSNYK